LVDELIHSMETGPGRLPRRGSSQIFPALLLAVSAGGQTLAP
jgi:hypothetical protein